MVGSILFFCLFLAVGYAQTDSIFERVTKSVKDFKFDTAAAPNDKFTRKIKELKSLRGGFNINEAVSFKMEEEVQKKEISKEEYEKISSFFTVGNGKIWLDNAMTSIYRKHFTYVEIKQLIKFYKTSAGKKMTTDFPIIMLESLRAAEMIKEMYEQQKASSSQGK
jgi:hypothetical protein